MRIPGREPPSSSEERLERRISKAGLLSYAAFIGMVLYDPRYGYYRAGKQEGKDYFTSPEIHGLFGRTLGRYITDLCDRLGETSVTVLELGGAGGKLAADIVSGLSRLSLKGYLILEKGEERVSGRLRWVKSLRPLPVMEGFVFVVAHEFFDALPFHRLINRGGRLEEIYLGRKDGFFEQTGALSKRVVSFLGRCPVFFNEQQAAEVTPAAGPIVRQVSRLVRKGCLLVFDYGYHQADIAAGRFFRGSMLGYKDRLARQDVFASPGSMDITHHVNFDHLSALFEREGWRRGGEIAQYRFLCNAGILEAFAALSGEQRLAAKWLINPEGLGSTISVLGFSRGISAPLPGFGRA